MYKNTLLCVTLCVHRGMSPVIGGTDDDWRDGLTFFFIPVIPLKWGETFVQCSTCKAGFNEAILSTPTNKQFSYMIALGARAMYAKAVAAGPGHSEQMIDLALGRIVPIAFAYTAATRHRCSAR